MKLSDFPLDIVPDTFHDFTLEVHRASGLPVPQIFASVLTTVGALCRSGVVGLEPDRSNGVRPNLYTISAGHPGTGKGVADDLIHAPLEAASAEFDAEWQDCRADCYQELKKLKKDLDDLDKKDPDFKARNRSLIRRIDLIETVLGTAGPSLDMSDATSQAHAEQMAVNEAFWQLRRAKRPAVGGTVAVVSKDGGKALSWILPVIGPGGVSIQQSGTSLNAWSGERVKSKRVGKVAVTANEAVTSYLLTVTPPTLRSFLSSPGVRGDGLCSRFLYLCYDGWQRHERFKKPDQAIVNAYNHECLRLFRQFGMAGEQTVVRFSQAASDRLHKMRGVVIDKAAAELLDIRELTVRWTEMSAKIALILHLMHLGPNADGLEISFEFADAACKMMNYYAEELVRILNEERMKTLEGMDRKIYDVLMQEEHQIGGLKLGEGWRFGIGKTATESKELLYRAAKTGLCTIVYTWAGKRESATAFLPVARGLAVAQEARDAVIAARAAEGKSTRNSLDPANSTIQMAVVSDAEEAPKWELKGKAKAEKSEPTYEEFESDFYADDKKSGGSFV